MKPSYFSAIVMLAGMVSMAFAQQSPDDQEHQRSNLSTHGVFKDPLRLGPHNGLLNQVGDLQTETVISSAGLQVYLFTASGQPLAIDKARGVASLTMPVSVKRYRYDLFPGEDNSLIADVDLSRVAGRQVAVECQLLGVASSTISYREVCVLPVAAGLSVALGTEQVHAGVFKVSGEDALFISAQQNCPVIDKPLSSMGGPYKVNADGKAIYICCPGCAKKIAAEPQKYLAVLKSQGVNVPVVK